MNKQLFLFAASILGFTAMAREDVGTTSGKTTRSNKTVEELCQPSRAQSDLNINNVRIEQVPDVIVARMFNFGPFKLLEFTAEETRDVDMKQLFT
jgi:hypothetical protein